MNMPLRDVQVLDVQSLATQQRKGMLLLEIITYLETRELPDEEKRAWKPMSKVHLFTIENKIL